MINYLIESVFSFESLPIDATAIIVHKLHRTPYHIGIIHRQDYYSLTIDGVEHAESNEMIASLLNKSNNNLILLLNSAIRNERIADFFVAKNLNDHDFFSCLSPVKLFLSATYSNNKIAQANNLFELIDILKSLNLVKNQYATRMNDIMEGKIVLERYDEDAIKKHIRKLKEAKTREASDKNIR